MWNLEADGWRQQKATLVSQEQETETAIFWLKFWWVSISTVTQMDGRVSFWCKQHETTDASCIVSNPLVSTQYHLNATPYPSILSLYDHSVMSQSSSNLKLASWIWQWVTCIQMASRVTRSESSRSPLWCGERGDLHHECAADKSQAAMWRSHVNKPQNL